jgi:hypothetical protein
MKQSFLWEFVPQQGHRIVALLMLLAMRKTGIYDGMDDSACFWLNRINLIKERGVCQGILVL